MACLNALPRITIHGTAPPQCGLDGRRSSREHAESGSSASLWLAGPAPSPRAPPRNQAATCGGRLGMVLHHRFGRRAMGEDRGPSSPPTRCVPPPVELGVGRSRGGATRRVWEWRTRWRDLERSSSTWWRVVFRRRLGPNVSASTGAWRRERGRRRLGPASDDRLVVGDVKHDRFLQGFHLGCRGGVGQRRCRGLWPWPLALERTVPQVSEPRWAESNVVASPIAALAPVTRTDPACGPSRSAPPHRRVQDSHLLDLAARCVLCLGIPGDARSGPARTPRWPGRCHTLRGEGLRGADWCHAAPRRLANRDVPRGASRS